MDRTVRHIVIVGGGTAGWLTAGVIAAEHRADRPDGLRVSVVESPDVPIIGVGEGTWPTIRDTLHRIGVSESDFIRDCDASFKQGSRFDRWVDGSDGDRYFHPFSLPEGHGDVDIAAAWRALAPQVPFAEFVCAQPHLCLHGLAPKQATTPEFAAVANYAYHLDAGKFAVFLRRHCAERLGVQHVADHVVDVDMHENGDIAALQLRAQGRRDGDLFVDCSGFQAMLIGQRLGVPSTPLRDVLFNDRALAVQVPYARDDAPIASQTISTAQPHGWVWDIGLPTRRGIGYVYASAHVDDATAADALHEYLARTSPGVEIPSFRQLAFDPGWRERPWVRNCVAIGLSSGFIEPLEASAIAMVELSAAALADRLPATRDDMDRLAPRFNAAFAHRWRRVIDFLKLHYVLSRREGDYWRAHRDASSIPESLAGLLATWAHHPPSRYDLDRVDEVFPSASWQYILYGMGFVSAPPTHPTRFADTERAAALLRDAAPRARRMLGALPAHRDLLDHIARHGLPRI
ncbi:tryptophan halogenase family protein [Cognatilysobacter terrigena]|uniref:tryptophan halogenase family protein n=1 Tax=Cognatilysobacter terrigena TaxID=2488749 RepID=UPI001060EE05|nr:tryptophan halogenase family protein [Lysobacter terrigena]